MQHQPRRRAPKPRHSPAALERLHPHAAGIDCGAAEHFVARRPLRRHRAGVRSDTSTVIAPIAAKLIG